MMLERQPQTKPQKSHWVAEVVTKQWWSQA